MEALSYLSRFLQETSSEEESHSSSRKSIAAVLSNIFLFFLIFGLAATVEIKSLQRQLSNKFAICLGVAMQFLIMPLLGFLAVTMFGKAGLTYAMGITLLVVTASPGGSYSNWWCSTFNAELALSVAMTTISSILSIGFLPANLFLYTYLAYGQNKSIVEALDFKAIFFTLGIVIGAIISGLYSSYRWNYPRFHIYANRVGSICGVLLILISLFLSSGGDGSDSKLWNQHWPFYAAVAFPCLIGISLANIISRSLRMKPPETVAIAIECCYQNTGIATSVAITMFSDVNERAQAVAVPLFYGVVEALVILLYCLWAWKAGWTKAPPHENICVVISKTYEVETHENNDGNAVDEVDEDQNNLQQNDETSYHSALEEGYTEVVAVQTASYRRQSSTSMWSRLFPSALVSRISLLLFSNHPTPTNDKEGSEVDDPAQKSNDGVQVRSRLNTDQTADTSLCSGSSSQTENAPARTRLPSSVELVVPPSIPEAAEIEGDGHCLHEDAAVEDTRSTIR